MLAKKTKEQILHGHKNQMKNCVPLTNDNIYVAVVFKVKTQLTQSIA